MCGRERGGVSQAKPIEWVKRKKYRKGENFLTPPPSYVPMFNVYIDLKHLTATSGAGCLELRYFVYHIVQRQLIHLTHFNTKLPFVIRCIVNVQYGSKFYKYVCHRCSCLDRTVLFNHIYALLNCFIYWSLIEGYVAHGWPMFERLRAHVFMQ